MASLFEFRWAVDQDGYEIEHVPGRAGGSLLQSVAYDRIRRRGGPLRQYRPLDDHPGLWRRFANCRDASDALAFVQEYGLVHPIGDEPDNATDSPDGILRTAELVRQVAAKIDNGDYLGAAELWNDFAFPRLTAELIPANRSGRFDFRPVPLTLGGALLLQAGEAIAHNQKWRHCRNDGCPEWFRVGEGAHTSRRQFCSDRCRVAWARRQRTRREA